MDFRVSPRWRAAALVGALVLTAAACGGGNQGGNQPSQSGGGLATGVASLEVTPQATSALAPPETDVEFEFWTGLSGPDGNFMQALVDQFNESTPTVEVTLLRHDAPQYYTQINNAFTAGQPPAMMIMHIDALARYAAEDRLQPVTALAEEANIEEEDFTEAVWAGAQWQGEQFAVPLDVHPAVLYVNMGLLEEAGIDEPPTDRESFEAALQACKDAGHVGPGGNPIVWSNHGFSASLFWASLFYQGGGEWTNEDYTQATFNSEAGVQAAAYMRDLIDRGLHEQDVATDVEVNEMLAGNTCMATTGIWQTTRLSETLADDFALAQVPQIFDQPGNWAGSHTLAIANGVEGDQLRGVYYFISWLSENSGAWAPAGQIPARNEARESEAFQEVEHIPDIAEEAYEAAQFPPPIPRSGDMLFGEGGVTEQLLKVLTADEDPQAVLDEAADTYTEILAEVKEQYGF